MATTTASARAPARRRPPVLALATAFLTPLLLVGCDVLGAPGLREVRGVAPAYAELGVGAAEVRVTLPDAGVFGGRGTIDGSGAFAIDLDTGIDASVLPPITDLRIGGADLFGVSVSDRSARGEVAEVGVVAGGVGVGLLYLSNVDAPPSPTTSGVVLATPIYMDRPVSLDGTAQGPGTTVRYSARIPRGWSYFVVRRGTVSPDAPVPYTVTSAPVDGLGWLYEPVDPFVRGVLRPR